MSILSLRTNSPGENYLSARLCKLSSSDALASCIAAGYLDKYLVMNSIALYASDFVHVAASDGTQIYKPSFTNGTPQNGGSVQLVALG